MYPPPGFSNCYNYHDNAKVNEDIGRIYEYNFVKI